MAEQQKTTPAAAKPAPGADTTEDRLRAENAELRRQLAAVGGGRVVQPEHTFQLSEGDRQELEIRGVINVGGRLVTKSEVLEMLGDKQQGVKIADAPAGTRVDPALIKGSTGPGVEGVDYIYPSVERGKLDPAVAGTPGISGPPADRK